jgi:hypothetical protein
LPGGLDDVGEGVRGGDAAFAGVESFEDAGGCFDGECFDVVGFEDDLSGFTLG